jgi:ribosomal protein L37AE/L43A
MSTDDGPLAFPVPDGTDGDHEPTLANIPAIPAEDPVPVAETRAPAIRCGGCGETFAQGGFGGKALFLAETLHAAALAAGWAESTGKWTCSVCLAGITGPLYGPEREPAPSLPVPESDPLDQSIAILDEFNARVPGMWAEVDRSNGVTAHKNMLRFGDGYHGLAALFGRTPDLRDDPEAAVALLNYKAKLAERAEAMHRESLMRREAENRALEERLAKLRGQPLETGVAA